MMRLAPFHFVAPKSLDEVLSRLADDPVTTRLVAGGTDLIPNLKRRHQSASTVVSLARIPALAGKETGVLGDLALGAMTRLSTIVRSKDVLARHPGLIRAVASISTPVLRNMGTIGGNLCLDTRCTYYNQDEEWRRAIGYCLKEVGTTCWVAPSSPRCWAISASDSAPLLAAIGARVRLVSVRGTREIPVTALFKNDGIDYLTKARDEVLTSVLLPSVKGQRSTYWKLRRRGSIDFPVLGVGASLTFEKDVVVAAEIHLGAVASHPLRCADASAFLVGKVMTKEIVEEAARLSREPATPMDNTDFTLQWRRQMVATYVGLALSELADLEPPATAPFARDRHPASFDAALEV